MAAQDAAACKAHPKDCKGGGISLTSIAEAVSKYAPLVAGAAKFVAAAATVVAPETDGASLVVAKGASMVGNAAALAATASDAYLYAKGKDDGNSFALDFVSTGAGAAGDFGDSYVGKAVAYAASAMSWGWDRVEPKLQGG